MDSVGRGFLAGMPCDGDGREMYVPPPGASPLRVGLIQEPLLVAGSRFAKEGVAVVVHGGGDFLGGNSMAWHGILTY